MQKSITTMSWYREKKLLIIIKATNAFFTIIKNITILKAHIAAIAIKINKK